MRKDMTIGAVGAGGDGVMVLGSLLQYLTASRGYFSQMPRFYGAQIRGGASAVKLGLNAGTLSLPKDVMDILVCFNWEKYLEFKQELPFDEHTIVFYEKDAPKGITLPARSFRIPFSERSERVTGSPLSKNIVALGLLARALGLASHRRAELVRESEELTILSENLAAFEDGGSLLLEAPLSELELVSAMPIIPKVVLHGNEAIARAAIYAGCQAFFGYPITPESEIMEYLAQELPKKNSVFLQAEDEIASAGLALGASLVGVKAMTATSGPGFDLMTEMMGLAAADEIPLVIIDVQRGGPSTGMPSKSEQSDLSHALYGGHGDAPRVVLAPYDLEGCYRLTIESFNIAEYYQALVILLSDQWLGQTLVATNDDFLRRNYPIIERKRPAADSTNNYLRYQLTPDFISPMADVGAEGFVYQTTGLTHNENGTPSFDVETSQLFHEKIWRKLLPLTERDDLCKIFGNPLSTKGIMTWGSSAQAVLAAVKDLGLEDEVRVCIPELICPLPDKVKKFLESTERLLIVEMNYSGQFHNYLRSQVGLPKKTMVYKRAGGRPFTSLELSEPLSEALK
ncbi:MAG: hypothetical protein A2Y60_05710 [Chloroflexi bacterium RBG_13_54_9]|nr:MAG: hypothetical protein A2Y60_05710 [Chloroflexi bacterium RBG_13_54_9]